MQIDEASVARATEMPGEGARWFKTTTTKNLEFRSYLKPEHRGIIWKKEIPKGYLEEKWLHLLKMIRVYITCECRYNRIMLYHFRILNHFTGKSPINMPFYLHRSLTKMAQSVQRKPRLIASRLFHQGLIKLIMLEELRLREMT